MARPLRIQYEGALYHITCWGNERRDIFKDDDDRREFLSILEKSLAIYSVKLFAYVLMRNHFHLLAETPLGNLAEFMRHFNITYTGYFNRKHRRVGHLYQGRYKSILVDKEVYLSVLSRYVHLNPVRVRAVAKQPTEERRRYLSTYSWSSLPGYLDKKKRAAFLDYSMVLAEYGGDTDQARTSYKKQLYNDLSDGIDVTDGMVVSTIIGNERFLTWIRETFLKKEKCREQPSAGMIHRLWSRDAILAAVEKETGKDVGAIRKDKGDLRRITMELLYRHGRLKGPEIGVIFGVDYSSVSQERKRLRERIVKDPELVRLFTRFERVLSSLKI
jgi:REP-associated tyrosine transposase